MGTCMVGVVLLERCKCYDTIHMERSMHMSMCGGMGLMHYMVSVLLWHKVATPPYLCAHRAGRQIEVQIHDTIDIDM